MQGHFCIIRVRTGTDFEVAEKLIEAGFNAVCITVSKTSLHKRSKKVLKKCYPYLQGYLFVQVADEQWQKLKRFGGVLGPLRSEGGTGVPCHLSATLVEHLQSSVELSKEAVEPMEIEDVLYNIDALVTFDMFGSSQSAKVSRVAKNMVTAKTTINGKSVTVTRPSQEFRAA